LRGNGAKRLHRPTRCCQHTAQVLCAGKPASALAADMACTAARHRQGPRQVLTHPATAHHHPNCGSPHPQSRAPGALPRRALQRGAHPSAPRRGGRDPRHRTRPSSRTRQAPRAIRLGSAYREQAAHTAAARSLRGRKPRSDHQFPPMRAAKTARVRTATASALRSGPGTALPAPSV
jgi:hypothetical protein